MPFQSYTPELDEMFVFSALSALFDFSSERCPHPQKSLMGIWLRSHSAELLARQDRAQLITTIKSGVFSIEKLEKLREKSIITTAYHKKAWRNMSPQDIEEERVALFDMRSKNSTKAWEKRKADPSWDSKAKKKKRSKAAEKAWEKKKADPSYDSKVKKAERSAIAKKRGDSQRAGYVFERDGKWVSISIFMFIKCFKA